MDPAAGEGISQASRRKLFRGVGISILAAAGFQSLLAIASGQQSTGAAGSLYGAVDLKERDELASAAVSTEGLIRLDVTVTDSNGDSPDGLQKTDFKLLDNGRPQKIVAFQASKDFANAEERALQVVILLDTLGLPHGTAASARDQVVQFVRSQQRNLPQPVTVYSLEDSGFFLTANPTTDRESLAADVSADKKLGTYFLSPHVHPPLKSEVDPQFDKYPALAGIRALWTIATAKSHQPERKLLLWIGPGLGSSGTGAFHPDGSALPNIQDGGEGFSIAGNKGVEVRGSIFQKITWFSILLREARITLDCITIGNDQLAPDIWQKFSTGTATASDANWMGLFKHVLAVQSGGRVLPSSSSLAEAMNERVRSARTFYSVTFDPSAAGHPDEYHSLKIELGRPDLTAAVATGYYDQPFYTDPPNPGARPTTVAQLEQLCDGGHCSSRELQNVVLTERLSHAKLRSLLEQSHNKQMQQALQLIADQSTFLDPPAADLIVSPPPDEAEQRRMIEAAAGYLDGIIPRLPNFFASRTAFSYREISPYPGLPSLAHSEPLHLVLQTSQPVMYRKGAEEVRESLPGPQIIATPAAESGLHTYGIFGPILNFVRLVMTSPTNITWGWWEQSPEGRRAVFRYSMPSISVLTLAGCCYPNGGAGSETKIAAPSHGEFAVDPATGAILRFRKESDLPGFVPSKQADIMVSYGPVVISGATYILPLRSVSIMRNRSVVTLQQWNLGFSVFGPYETKMNVFAFDKYHMFRGGSRLLPGYTQNP